MDTFDINLEWYFFMFRHGYFGACLYYFSMKFWWILFDISMNTFDISMDTFDISIDTFDISMDTFDISMDTFDF